jgi:hypothetical protein
MANKLQCQLPESPQPYHKMAKSLKETGEKNDVMEDNT